MIKVVTDPSWKERIGNYVKKKTHFQENYKDDFSFIGFVENDTIMAGMLFTDFDGYNIWVHLSIESPRIVKRSYIKLMFDYCFNQLNCGRMTAMCKDGYLRNERLLKGVGFIKEGVIRESMKIENTYYNGALYGILKNECKWIK